jgi:hypothetical protein
VQGGLKNEDRLDMCHLYLSRAERETLATKMTLKIPFIQVLDEVRDFIHGSELERIHLLTKKDLYNIEKCFFVRHCQNLRILSYPIWSL